MHHFQVVFKIVLGHHAQDPTSVYCVFSACSAHPTTSRIIVLKGNTDTHSHGHLLKRNLKQY